MSAAEQRLRAPFSTAGGATWRLEEKYSEFKTSNGNKKEGMLSSSDQTDATVHKLATTAKPWL